MVVVHSLFVDSMYTFMELLAIQTFDNSSHLESFISICNTLSTWPLFLTFCGFTAWNPVSFITLFCSINQHSPQISWHQLLPIFNRARVLFTLGIKWLIHNVVENFMRSYLYFCKVRTFWEAHIIWKNLPRGFDIY